MSKNHFSTLGLKPGASEDEIKKSYRSLAKKYHPDKNKDPGAEDKFKEIAAAYEYLQSADRRYLLEQDLKKPKPKDPPPKTKAPSGDGFSSFFKPKGDHSDSSKFGHNESSYSSKYQGAGHSKKYGTDNTEESYSWRRKDKKGQKPKKKKKPWESEWNSTEDQYEKDTDHPSFSFAFRTFVDDLDSNFSMFFSSSGPFEFSAFFGDNTDPFAQFFSDTGGTGGFEGKKPKERKRHVAEEYGYCEGLDEEYLFSPRQGQSRGDNQYDTDTDDEPGFRFSLSESDSEDDYQDTRFKCAFCGKRLKLETLKTHEPACGRSRKTEINIDSGDEIDPNGYAAKFASRPRKTDGDWRSTHEELLRHIRRQRRKSKEYKEMHDLETVLCKWCGRSFSRKASEKHIPFCEKWTKENGRPMSPVFTHHKKSKTDRAKEYARRVPKPKGHKVQDDVDEDVNTPRDIPTPRDKYTKVKSPRPTSFPDIKETGRQTADKPFPHSGTGLHPSTPRSTHTTPRSTTSKNTQATTSRIHGTRTPKFRSTDDPKLSNTKGDNLRTTGASYGGGLRGTGLSGVKATGLKPSKANTHHVRFT